MFFQNAARLAADVGWQKGDRMVAKKRWTETDSDSDVALESEPEAIGQRLYVLGYDKYVQHDGSKNVPRELKEYVAARNGECVITGT